MCLRIPSVIGARAAMNGRLVGVRNCHVDLREGGPVLLHRPREADEMTDDELYLADLLRAWGDAADEALGGGRSVLPILPDMARILDDPRIRAATLTGSTRAGSAVAERAGVSVRTVIRRFGSRNGVIAAAIESDASGIVAERDQAAAGDVEGALAILLAHYERDGDAVVRTLALEATVPEAKAIADAGRAGHRAWCARIFAPHLPPPADADHDVRLDALVAATDLYVWKLLRRDLGRSEEETMQVIRTLVDGLRSPSPSRA